MDKKKAMGWFIIIIMSFSILGFVGGAFFADSAQSDYEREEYNGYSFISYQGQWVLELGEQQIPFLNFPKDLESISINKDLNSWKNQGRIYVGFDSASNSSQLDNQVQFTRGLFSLINLRAQDVCVEGDLNCGDIPDINCVNPTLIYEESEGSEVSFDQECVVIKYNSNDDLIKFNEMIIFKVLGVMN
jgi:hypothetical protein